MYSLILQFPQGKDGMVNMTSQHFKVNVEIVISLEENNFGGTLCYTYSVRDQKHPLIHRFMFFMARH